MVNLSNKSTPVPKPVLVPTPPKKPVSSQPNSTLKPKKELQKGLVMQDRDVDLLLFAINTLISCYQHHNKSRNEKEKLAHAKVIQVQLEQHIKKLNHLED